jgi:BASS family bile acid:Na+ symporter
LFLAAALHNLAGYFFGYWLSRAAGLDKNSAFGRVRSRLQTAAWPRAWLDDEQARHGRTGAGDFQSVNISGSILANYWRRHPVKAPDACRRPAAEEDEINTSASGHQ